MTDTKLHRGQMVETPAGRGTIENVTPAGKLIVRVSNSGSYHDWRCLTPWEKKRSTWKFSPSEIKIVSIE